MTSDELFMRKTFDLAKRGLGTTWPNPIVGALIVKNGEIIAEGFHLRKGEAHAELDAIKKAKTNLKGATLYVNLEPCCHFNKSTPPCAQRIIEEGISEVVISNLDPNKSVNGNGVDLLRKHGINVRIGVLHNEGEKINEVFFTAMRKNRPFIHLKSAVTLDGKIAMKSGESQWITGEEARTHVHYLRSLHQGILIGGETVRKDNPRLTVRLSDYHRTQPWRIIFSQTGELPSKAHLFNDEHRERTLIYTQNKLSFDFPSQQVMRVKDITEALNDLFQKQIINIFMEAGPRLASTFLQQGLMDRLTLFISPSILGEGKNLFSHFNTKTLQNRPKLNDIESHWFGNDHYITGRL
jgi:diaminohydroxyphosphoribosylaminopyrimidine deaminase/5-amino-6-(5-phosphoribosylamino)uracil reductase